MAEQQRWGKRREGWGRSGRLVTGRPANFLSMSVEFDRESEFTIQGTLIQPKASKLTSCFAVLVAEWTVNGNTQTRKVDLASGQAISGVAETLRALIIDATPVDQGFKRSVEYGATMLVAPFPRPGGCNPPTLTAVRATTVAPLGFLDPVPIPEGANSVAIYAASPGGAFVALEELGAKTTPIDTVPLLAISPILGEFTPLVAGVTQIAVQNVGPAPAVISVVFGIDG